MKPALQSDPTPDPAEGPDPATARAGQTPNERATFALRDEDAFESRADVQAWLSSAMVERLGGAAERAGASPRQGSRPFALSASDLDKALSRLSTRRLQALLLLEQHSRAILVPDRAHAH